MKAYVPLFLINYENQMQDFRQRTRPCYRMECYMECCKGECFPEEPSDEEIERLGKEFFAAAGRRIGVSEAEGKKVVGEQLAELNRRERRRVPWCLLGGIACALAAIALWWWQIAK